MIADSVSLDEVATELARTLGDGWGVRPYEIDDGHQWNWNVDGPDGMGVFLTFYHRRVQIGGHYPHRGGAYDTVPYGVDRPSISVSPTRTVAAIVADIARRFMLAYRDVWAHAVNRAHDLDTYAANKADATAEFLAAWPGSSERNGTVYVPGGQADVSADPPRVYFTRLSVTLEQAIRIAAVLR